MPWGLRSTQRNKARSPALIDPCEMFDLPLASTCYAHPYSGHTDKGAHTVYHPPLMPIIGVRARPSDSQAPTAPLATVARPRLDVRQAGDGGVWAACVGEFRLSCLTGLPLSCPRRVDLVKAVNKSRLSCVGTGLESAEYCRSSVSRPLETVSGGLEVCVARRRDSERVLKKWQPLGSETLSSFVSSTCLLSVSRPLHFLVHCCLSLYSSSSFSRRFRNLFLSLCAASASKSASTSTSSRALLRTSLTHPPQSLQRLQPLRPRREPGRPAHLRPLRSQLTHRQQPDQLVKFRILHPAPRTHLTLLSSPPHSLSPSYRSNATPALASSAPTTRLTASRPLARRPASSSKSTDTLSAE